MLHSHTLARGSALLCSDLSTRPRCAGIGYACALALGRAGCRVALADVDAAALAAAEEKLGAEGIESTSLVCDVGDKAQVERAVSAAAERLGGLHIAVANAGIVKAAPFLEMTEDDFDAVIRVNLKGVFLVSGG